MVVFVALATVLALPLVGLFFFRLYENQLIRQTEAELIAQSRRARRRAMRAKSSSPGAGHCRRRSRAVSPPAPIS